jgi:hypothetical protein
VRINLDDIIAIASLLSMSKLSTRGEREFRACWPSFLGVLFLDLLFLDRRSWTLVLGVLLSVSLGRSGPRFWAFYSWILVFGFLSGRPRSGRQWLVLV